MNKEELINQIKEIRDVNEERRKVETGMKAMALAGRLGAYRFALEKIEQLDEPETLSQQWIDEHQKPYTMENSVEISDLQNLIVNEPAKPVIPEFVANYIENKVEHDSPLQEYKLLQEIPGNEGVADWADDNQNEFCVACIIGYEVEKEKEYVLWLDLPQLSITNRLYLSYDKNKNEYTVIPSMKDLTTFTESDLEDIDETGFVREDVTDCDDPFQAF